MDKDLKGFYCEKENVICINQSCPEGLEIVLYKHCFEEPYVRYTLKNGEVKTFNNFLNIIGSCSNPK